MPEKESPIKSVLSKIKLFQCFDDKQLTDISNYSDLNKHDPNSLIYEYSELKQSVPFMIVASGCAGVVHHPIHKRTEDVINALIMPYQTIGEFQFLGEKFPDSIQIITFAKTSIISIDSEYLTELVKDNAVFYRNLAETLVEKLNINNFHLFIRHFSSGFDKKCSFYLYNILTHPVWSRILLIKSSSKYKIPIYWTVNSLGKYLSTKHRSVASHLATIIESGAIEISWYSNSYKKLDAIDIKDVENLGKEESKLKYDTLFQISVTDRNKLLGFFVK